MPPDIKSASLYKAHREALVDYANGIVRDRARAEDVVQDAWVRIDEVERHRPLQEPLRYFYRIVRNLALDGYRARQREISKGTADIGMLADSVAAANPSPEAEAGARAELRLVLESLDELPDRTRRAVMLYKFDGLKLREVAERMGISVALANKLVLDGVAHCAQRLARKS
ncbi:sigma-70 family RNA polymerase sigma factor [Niveispirillum fermenti]|uniref:sigma-70 family RNA polymerase sigma factor n=1 Tax=Niveispirillum fermenti TaxID=1233113 RepID=UPI003A8AB750